ncbi:MAG: hypothetical protein PHV34_09890 [Verrucomicrobiae bacterium]|nr:hypothetical protein [Verrucomicrobiae bacterium]
MSTEWTIIPGGILLTLSGNGRTTWTLTDQFGVSLPGIYVREEGVPIGGFLKGYLPVVLGTPLLTNASGQFDDIYRAGLPSGAKLTLQQTVFAGGFFGKNIVTFDSINPIQISDTSPLTLLPSQ